ncbi:MAG: nuclear transport factor 2 family protein [Glaciimonas sp.]|nr:nuclear transport factor 2 family protein [Glaciimonas sp.]
MSTSLEIIERQFEAYNASDLEKFISNFSESYHAYRMPTLEPYIVGKAQLTEFYATKRFNDGGMKLQAELISRTVMGNKVVDCERISGISDSPVDMIVIYEIRDGLIASSWAFSAV